MALRRRGAVAQVGDHVFERRRELAELARPPEPRALRQLAVADAAHERDEGEDRPRDAARQERRQEQRHAERSERRRQRQRDAAAGGAEEVALGRHRADDPDQVVVDGEGGDAGEVVDAVVAELELPRAADGAAVVVGRRRCGPPGGAGRRRRG
jgi:hypothetical protein